VPIAASTRRARSGRAKDVRCSTFRCARAAALRLTALAGSGVLLCVSLLAGEHPGGQIDIRQDKGWLTIRAQAARLEDVLTRLSAVAGSKVVYGGAPPRGLVSAEVRRQAPADAVVALLAGQGVDFAIQLDARGHQIQTIFIAGERDPRAAEAGRAEPAAAREVEPEPAEPEVDEPEGLIHSAEGDPIAVSDKEQEQEQGEGASEPAPVASPTPTPPPEERSWPSGPLRSPFAAGPKAQPTPTPHPPERTGDDGAAGPDGKE
jgi:hypothetical protein